jgi:hypothetical protein
VETPAPIPEHLLTDPCDAVGAGLTVSSLSRGYVQNTTCIGQFKNTMGGVREYNNTIKDLKKKTNKKGVGDAN